MNVIVNKVIIVTQLSLYSSVRQEKIFFLQISENRSLLAIFSFGDIKSRME